MFIFECRCRDAGCRDLQMAPHPAFHFCRHFDDKRIIMNGLKLSKLISVLTKLNIKLYDIKLLWPISATFVIPSWHLHVQN